MPFLFTKNEKQIEMLQTSNIMFDPNQPRRTFSDKAIEELANSIKVHGILQPLLVRPYQNDFILVAGERRLRAARSIGITKVPVIILSKTEKECAQISLIENLQREELSFFEEALAFKRLCEEFGMTQTEIAQTLCKKQSTISNKMRLLKLPPAAQAIITANKLTERHARELIKINDKTLLYDTLDKIVKKNLNVTQTEQYINSLITPKTAPKRNFKVGEMKLCLNTINKAINLLKKSGIKPQTQLQESEGFVEYIIKIPKTS